MRAARPGEREVRWDERMSWRRMEERGAPGVAGCEDVIIENEARETSPRRRGPFEGLALRNELGILTDA